MKASRRKVAVERPPAAAEAADGSVCRETAVERDRRAADCWLLGEPQGSVVERPAAADEGRPLPMEDWSLLKKGRPPRMMGQPPPMGRKQSAKQHRGRGGVREFLHLSSSKERTSRQAWRQHGHGRDGRAAVRRSC